MSDYDFGGLWGLVGIVRGKGDGDELGSWVLDPTWTISSLGRAEIRNYFVKHDVEPSAVVKQRTCPRLVKVGGRG